MSEDPGEYRVELDEESIQKNLSLISGRRLQRSQLISDLYFRQVATFAEAAVIAGASEIDDIAEFAVSLTDKLIEMTKEK